MGKKSDDHEGENEGDGTGNGHGDLPGNRRAAAR
jgi:hypothetical protein